MIGGSTSSLPEPGRNIDCKFVFEPMRIGGADSCRSLVIPYGSSISRKEVESITMFESASPSESSLLIAVDFRITISGGAAIRREAAGLR